MEFPGRGARGGAGRGALRPGAAGAPGMAAARGRAGAGQPPRGAPRDRGGDGLAPGAAGRCAHGRARGPPGGACSSGFCTKTASTAARSRAWTLLWIPDRYVVVQVSPGASVQAVWPLSGPNLEAGPVALSPGTGQLFVALHPYNDQADLYIVDLLMPGPDGVSLYDPTNAFGQDWLPAVSAMAAAGGGLWKIGRAHV